MEISTYQRIYRDIVLFLLCATEFSSGVPTRKSGISAYNVRDEMNYRHNETMFHIKKLKLLSDLCELNVTVVSPEYMCCSRTVFPRHHFRYKCLEGIPYKRTKPHVPCGDKTLWTKEHKKNYGCCGEWRYKRSQIVCYKENTFKRLNQVPCPEGFQTKRRKKVLNTGNSTEEMCERCSSGYFSDKIGFDRCLKCKDCESVRSECTPFHDAICRERHPKHRRRHKHRKHNKKPSNAVRSSTHRLHKPADKANITKHGWIPWSESNFTTVPEGVDMEEVESWPKSASNQHHVMTYVVIIIGFCAIFVLLLAVLLVALQRFSLRYCFSKIRGRSPNRSFEGAKINTALSTIEEAKFLTGPSTDDTVNCLAESYVIVEERASLSSASNQKSSNRQHQGHRRCSSDSVITLSADLSATVKRLNRSLSDVKLCHGTVSTFVTHTSSTRFWPSFDTREFLSKDTFSLGDLSICSSLLPRISNYEVSPCTSQLFPLTALCSEISIHRLLENVWKAVSYSDVNVAKTNFLEKSTQTSLKKDIQKNLLGYGWDRGGHFDQIGGRLEASGSDVQLIIPKFAIEQSSITEVHGKVFTDLGKFVTIFALKDNERFVSPVVEFVSNRQCNFKRHVVVKIPIEPGMETDNTLRVLCVQNNNDLAVSTIPRLDELSNCLPDVYYELRFDGFVYVFTRHFTAFACSCCDRRQLYFEGLVFGKYTTKTDSSKTAEAGIRLFICDRLYLLRDFRSNLEQRLTTRGWALLDEKTLQLEESPLPSDEISMSIALLDETSKHWEEKTRADGTPLLDNPNKKISDLVLCPRDQEFPSDAGDWKFQCKNTSTPFECGLDIEHVTADKRRKRTTFCLIVNPESNKVKPVLPEKSILNVRHLSDCLGITETKQFGRLMGLTDTELDRIFSDNLNQAYECTYQTIQACERKLGPAKYASKLNEVLKKLKRMDLFLETETPNLDNSAIHEVIDPESPGSLMLKKRTVMETDV